MAKQKIKFVVRVIKWFDRVNGNTYHSCRITRTRDGKTIYCPYQYGYGEQYRYTTLLAMAENKWIPPTYRVKDQFGNNKFYSYERENDYPILWMVQTGTKRDCIENGTEK